MNISSSSVPHKEHVQGAFTHVSEHLHIIALSTVFFFAVDILSAPFGRAFFPKQYAGFNKKTQRVWRSRAVGEFGSSSMSGSTFMQYSPRPPLSTALVHAILCVPLCIWVYNYPTLRNDKVFGYDPTLGSVIAFSYG